jgi:hypothetical protein
MTFFVLTVCKLAVHCPEIAEALKLGRTGSKEYATQKLANFLAFWKSVDDDARLAYAVFMANGLPRSFNGDFKSRWGINFTRLGTKLLMKKAPTVIPLAIEPSKGDIEEVVEHLLKGRVLETKVSKPTWEPSDVPGGFVPLLNYTSTSGIRNKGLGELVWDMCAPSGWEMALQGSDDHNLFVVGESYASSLPARWKSKIRAMTPEKFHTKVQTLAVNGIAIGHRWRESTFLPTTRAMLLSGAFPICKIKDATQGKFEEWKSQSRKQEFCSAVLRDDGYAKLKLV